MNRYALLLPALMLIPGAANGQRPPPPAGDTTAVHTVRAGDTLWDLAGRYLRDPFLWAEIYRANRDIVADPNRIYPRERLRIPGLVVQPDAAAAPAGRADGQAPERTVFFGANDPAMPENRIELLEREEIPAVTAGDFYRAGLLVPEGDVVPVGRLAEVESPSVVPVQGQRAIQPSDRVFMPVSGAGVRVGDRLQLLRPGRVVRGYGRIFVATGLVSVVAVERGVATVVVDEVHDAVAVGDLAVPVPAYRVPVGVSPRPGAGLEGRILAFQSPHALQNEEDVAFVDLGSQNGLTEGDELAVVLPATRAAWGVRPEIGVARLRVVRVSARTAAVRVVDLEQPALEPGLPVRLVGKMP